jgi:hypothetical protein
MNIVGWVAYELGIPMVRENEDGKTEKLLSIEVSKIRAKATYHSEGDSVTRVFYKIEDDKCH